VTKNHRNQRVASLARLHLAERGVPGMRAMRETLEQDPLLLQDCSHKHSKLNVLRSRQGNDRSPAVRSSYPSRRSGSDPCSGYDRYGRCVESCIPSGKNLLRFIFSGCSGGLKLVCRKYEPARIVLGGSSWLWQREFNSGSCEACLRRFDGGSAGPADLETRRNAPA
jgi:hypothetical protein